MAARKRFALDIDQVEARTLREATERFWSKVDKSSTEVVLWPGVVGPCWLWERESIDSYGYGRFVMERRAFKAHRVAVWLSGREIPEGFDVDHLCGRKECVNPAHLEPVSVGENVRRRLLLADPVACAAAPDFWSTRCRKSRRPVSVRGELVCPICARGRMKSDAHRAFARWQSSDEWRDGGAIVRGAEESPTGDFVRWGRELIEAEAAAPAPVLVVAPVAALQSSEPFGDLEGEPGLLFGSHVRPFYTERERASLLARSARVVRGDLGEVIDHGMVLPSFHPLADEAKVSESKASYARNRDQARLRVEWDEGPARVHRSADQRRVDELNDLWVMEEGRPEGCDVSRFLRCLKPDPCACADCYASKAPR